MVSVLIGYFDNLRMFPIAFDKIYAFPNRKPTFSNSKIYVRSTTTANDVLGYFPIGYSVILSILHLGSSASPNSFKMKMKEK